MAPDPAAADGAATCNTSRAIGSSPAMCLCCMLPCCCHCWYHFLVTHKRVIAVCLTNASSLATNLCVYGAAGKDAGSVGHEFAVVAALAEAVALVHPTLLMLLQLPCHCCCYCCSTCCCVHMASPPVSSAAVAAIPATCCCHSFHAIAVAPMLHPLHFLMQLLLMLLLQL